MCKAGSDGDCTNSAKWMCCEVRLCQGQRRVARAATVARTARSLGGFSSFVFFNMDFLETEDSQNHGLHILK